MDERIAAALARLPLYTAEHVTLSAAALALGLLLSLPLSIFAYRRASLRWPLLTVVSVVQTIPSLALLALFYPLLLGLSSLAEHAFGRGFSALGFLPALLALTLYSMLPVVRNTVVGLASVDPALVEAARGVGMTDRQRLWQVELPLAAPTILAGVRTSAVWVIGTATLSTPIGQTSLGNFIFTGLQTENWIFVLVGCVAGAVLALVTDQLLGLIEIGLARRERPRIVVGAAGLLLGIAVAVVPMTGRNAPEYVVGAKTFPEQFILSRLLVDQLQENGLSASQLSGLGSTVILRALANNELDVYVDYSGTIWANAMGRRDNPGRVAVTREVTRWLAQTHGIVVLGELGFENAYALAMRRERAKELGVASIADLRMHAPTLVIGGDYEFFGRPEWSSIRQAYGVAFSRERQYQSTFMYRALADGDVDVVSAFSSDGRIASYDLKVLDDPAGAIPPYDALLLAAPSRAHDDRLRAALSPVVGKISIDLMRKANQRVEDAGAGGTPRTAARWLRSQFVAPATD
ncbi:ABC transporter permease/substrate-binding protein [Tahibacter soli]|uniref:ABC transporter permease/substrate-binding protein n=1 Tax=Tahibacter soli TaxID=2983605 RepID=A0A9X4BGI2_9GAMM|nr:ABC transporter permease/substrate-binding protein [Tahibacter soli]MDC8012810.1 ABC transporter permease/substrate-binding protein [Tahibacter soli]